jgi:hypothetical protein
MKLRLLRRDLDVCILGQELRCELQARASIAGAATFAIGCAAHKQRTVLCARDLQNDDEGE